MRFGALHEQQARGGFELPSLTGDGDDGDDDDDDDDDDLKRSRLKRIPDIAGD